MTPAANIVDLSGQRSATDASKVFSVMSMVGFIFGTLSGFFLMSAVEFDESASITSALLYGLPGLLVGAIVGLVGAVTLVQARRRLQATYATCVFFSAAAGALSLSLLYLLLAGFNPDPLALAVTAAAGAFPAAAGAAWLGLTARRDGIGSPRR